MLAATIIRHMGELWDTLWIYLLNQVSIIENRVSNCHMAIKNDLVK